MNLKWDYQLKVGERSNPAVYYEYITMPAGIPKPMDEQIAQVFGATTGKESSRLQTWGRTKDTSGKDILTNDPHYIAVLNGTPLHYDPKYPRYSYHLKIRVDSGQSVRGMDKDELALHRGVFYILDTHSPHQVLAKKKPSWNVAISLDSHELIHPHEVLPALIEYGLSANFVTGEVD